jgi:hypothetical protein
VVKYVPPLVFASSMVLLAACSPSRPPVVAPLPPPVAPPPIAAPAPAPEPAVAVTEETQTRRHVVRHRRHRIHKRIVRRKVIHEETTAPAETPEPRTR